MSPTRMVGLRPSRSARNPSVIAEIAIPDMVAYWNEPPAVSPRWNSRMTCGMTVPTESVVIANIANIAKTSAFSKGEPVRGCSGTLAVKALLKEGGHQRVSLARFWELRIVEEGVVHSVPRVKLRFDTRRG